MPKPNHKAPYHPQFKQAALDSLQSTAYNIQATARAFEISDATLRAWVKSAGLKLPDPAARALAASHVGRTTRWGDWQSRRQKAQQLRIRGQSLAAIAKALGYKSKYSGAHYAVSAAEAAAAAAKSLGTKDPKPKRK